MVVIIYFSKWVSQFKPTNSYSIKLGMRELSLVVVETLNKRVLEHDSLEKLSIKGLFRIREASSIRLNLEPSKLKNPLATFHSDVYCVERGVIVNFSRRSPSRRKLRSRDSCSLILELKISDLILSSILIKCNIQSISHDNIH